MNSPLETRAKMPLGSPGWLSPGRAQRDFRNAAHAAPALSQRGLPLHGYKNFTAMLSLRCSPYHFIPEHPYNPPVTHLEFDQLEIIAGESDTPDSADSVIFFASVMRNLAWSIAPISTFPAK
jgi:hypothetical protein